MCLRTIKNNETINMKKLPHVSHVACNDCLKTIPEMQQRQNDSV